MKTIKVGAIWRTYAGRKTHKIVSMFPALPGGAVSACGLDIFDRRSAGTCADIWIADDGQPTCKHCLAYGDKHAQGL